LRSLDAACARLFAEIAAMPVELSRTPELEGGISPCDLIAYQIGWGKLLLQWEALEQAGQPVVMPAPGYKWNQLGLLAQSFYQCCREYSLEQLLQQFAEVVEEIRQFIETSSDHVLFAVGARRWAGAKWPVVKWIQVNTIAPYGSARAKLRKWQKTVRQTL